MYELTSKGQGQNLTSNQCHVMTKIGHVAYQPMRLDETNARNEAIPNVLSLFNQELLTKTSL